MAGNALGTLFRITTFGESHGRAVGVLIDGVRPGVRIDLAQIQRELDRRRPGQSAVTTARKETDQVEVLSGIFGGRTLGTPICLVVWNRDQDSKAYDAIKDLFRPGHAAFTYLSKFGIQDYRGGGRSSGRETAGRVAAGALAQQLLAKRGISVRAYTLEAAGIRAERRDLDEIDRNAMRAPDAEAAARMARKVLRIKKEGDSAGGIVEAVVRGCPAGLGEPVFDKLEADLAKALLSIPAVKGFEIGSGFAAARMRGSEHNDAFYKERKSGKIRTRTNFAGGILGGISDGEEIVVRVAVKPPSSIPKAQETVDTKGRRRSISVEGRHDPCLTPRVVPVVEAMIALVLADHLVRQAATRGEHGLAPIRRRIDLIDDMLMLLISQRQELVADVGAWKRARKLPVIDHEREARIMEQRVALAAETGLDRRFLRDFFRVIIAHSRSLQ